MQRRIFCNAARKVGLNRFDGATGRFKTYKVDPKVHRSQACLSIAEASDGTLWLGTHYSGLHRFGPRSDEIKVFHPVPGDLNSLRDDSVPSVIVGDSGLPWTGTLSGLNSFDPKSGAFHVTTSPMGRQPTSSAASLRTPTVPYG